MNLLAAFDLYGWIATLVNIVLVAVALIITVRSG